MTDFISRTINLNTSFAIIEKAGRVTCYQGDVHELACLDDIHTLSIKTGKDVVFALPYCAIRERGFEAIGDEPILAIAVKNSISMDKAEFIADIADTPVVMEGDITPSISDDDYAALVRDFQINEIGGGNTSQTTLSRRFSGKILGLDNAVLLSIYRKLLLSRGQYMTILFGNIHPTDKTKNQYLIGATPERHIEVTGNETIMIPIAGTLRKEDRATFESRLEKFLTDPKEINELFQVVDEEMKIMGVVSPEGGEIYGPYLREIGAVVHTEYELVGKRCMNSIDALRRAMHAPTVVGSPMQSAARIIAKYEKTSRRYYAAEIGVYYAPRRANIYGDVDTAILIRTAEMFGDGQFHVQAGGGLVRDSIPEEEAKESRAKAMGMMGVILGSSITSDEYLTADLREKFAPVLAERNKRLSAFWMQRQNPYQQSEHNLHGFKVTIINNEDDFAHMIGHMITLSGAIVQVVDTFDYDAKTDQGDIIVIGPGPGDPTDMTNPRMQCIQDLIAGFKSQEKPILGICLGHQSLAVHEGLRVTRQSESTQGLQRAVKVFGKMRRLGFYNSFSPVYSEDARVRVDLRYDLDENNRIIAMQGDRFIGFQFHPESVMSEDGNDVMYRALMILKQFSAIN
jgi:phenazine biosynthesis protein phzE